MQVFKNTTKGIRFHTKFSLTNSNRRHRLNELGIDFAFQVARQYNQNLLLQEEGWKLNRNNYYQEGWLATGNVRGVVGVTFTSSHARRQHELPLRTNYNLRGHRSDVSIPRETFCFKPLHLFILCRNTQIPSLRR